MPGMSATAYTVSDGELVITLHEAAEGGFIVTTPLDPAVHTEAETIGEAFEMVRDAMGSLRKARVGRATIVR